MFDVTGVCAIPEDHNLKEVELGNGVILDFNVVAQEDRNDEVIFHRYRANMWIPKEELIKWRTIIVHGAVFYVRGKWASEIKEDQKYPFSVLKLYYKDFRPMAVARWWKGKE